MGFFDMVIGATQTIAKAATLPVSVAADVVTIGGTLTDSDSYTATAIEDLVDDVEETIEKLEK